MAIAVLFDVTGSMRGVPRALQAGAAQAGARVPGGVPEEITAAQATCILQSAKPSGTAGQEYLTRA